MGARLPRRSSQGEAAQEMPAVLALTEAEALAALEKAGHQVRVLVTRPPWPGQAEGQRRVVRQRLLAPGLVELTVASERCQRQGRGGHA